MKKGLTIIEVMVAILIISLAFLAMMRMFSVATMLGHQGDNLSVALSLARTRVEEVRNIDYDDLEVGETDVSLTPPPIPPETHQITKVEWVNDPDGSGNDYKKVTVTITWYEYNRTATLSLVTYVSAYD